MLRLAVCIDLQADFAGPSWKGPYSVVANEFVVGVRNYLWMSLRTR